MKEGRKGASEQKAKYKKKKKQKKERKYCGIRKFVFIPFWAVVVVVAAAVAPPAVARTQAGVQRAYALISRRLLHLSLCPPSIHTHVSRADAFQNHEHTLTRISVAGLIKFKTHMPISFPFPSKKDALLAVCTPSPLGSGQPSPNRIQEDRCVALHYCSSIYHASTRFSPLHPPTLIFSNKPPFPKGSSLSLALLAYHDIISHHRSVRVRVC